MYNGQTMDTQWTYRQWMDVQWTYNGHRDNGWMHNGSMDIQWTWIMGRITNDFLYYVPDNGLYYIQETMDYIILYVYIISNTKLMDMDNGLYIIFKKQWTISYYVYIISNIKPMDYILYIINCKHEQALENNRQVLGIEPRFLDCRSSVLTTALQPPVSSCLLMLLVVLLLIVFL